MGVSKRELIVRNSKSRAFYGKTYILNSIIFDNHPTIIYILFITTSLFN